MDRSRRYSSVAGRATPEGALRSAFRALAAGERLQDAGAAVLERACRALAAEEAVLLLAGAGGRDALLPGPRYGRGTLGTREQDCALGIEAMAAGRPLALDDPDEGTAELWCPMHVDGRSVGVLAVRRCRWEPFTPREHAIGEVLATGTALAADRLRFMELWWRKLSQADAQYSQLLRYADDLRTTYAAERRRSEELRSALQALEQAYAATVHALASAVEAKDAYTGGHLNRVNQYGLEVCRVLGMAETPGLSYGFLLHDLGKIGIPDAVLNKAGRLTEEEWALMREHPAIGLRILEGVPHLDVVREIVYCHHERWDGKGYPQGLAGEAIPPAARAFAVVDAFDAITTDRPYRRAASVEEALARLREAAGTQFAPEAVEAIHAVDRERLHAIRATAQPGR